MPFRKATDQFVTLQLLKTLVTDSPTLTVEVARSAEHIVRRIQESFIGLSSEIIRDAIQNKAFSPPTEINQFALEIYKFDVDIFSQIFDFVFRKMDTVRDFDIIKESIDNFQEETSCKVEAYCALRKNINVTPRYMSALSDVLETPYLDEDDVEKLEQILKNTTLDDFVPFIDMAANIIRCTIEANKFELTTEAHQLAVEVHNYDIKVYRKLFECVFDALDVDEYFKQIRASLDKFQNYRCAVDPYCVLYKKISALMDHLWGYECAVKILLQKSNLGEENQKKLTELLKQIKDTSERHLQSSAMMSSWASDFD